MARTLEDIRRLEYYELTNADWELLNREWITNGFGPSWNWFLAIILRTLAPLFDEASANIHDFSYWKWGGEWDRRNADFGFFERMVYDISSSKLKMSLRYATLAYIFFVAVRIRGKKYFNYH